MKKENIFASIILDPAIFLKGAIEATAFIKVTERIQKEESNKLIDDLAVKRAEDWSKLANQVVGAETF